MCSYGMIWKQEEEVIIDEEIQELTIKEIIPEETKIA